MKVTLELSFDKDRTGFANIKPGTTLAQAMAETAMIHIGVEHKIPVVIEVVAEDGNMHAQCPMCNNELEVDEEYMTEHYAEASCIIPQHLVLYQCSTCQQACTVEAFQKYKEQRERIKKLLSEDPL